MICCKPCSFAAVPASKTPWPFLSRYHYSSFKTLCSSCCGKGKLQQNAKEAETHVTFRPDDRQRLVPVLLQSQDQSRQASLQAKHKNFDIHTPLVCISVFPYLMAVPAYRKAGKHTCVAWAKHAMPCHAMPYHTMCNIVSVICKLLAAFLKVEQL